MPAKSKELIEQIVNPCSRSCAGACVSCRLDIEMVYRDAAERLLEEGEGIGSLLWY